MRKVYFLVFLIIICFNLNALSQISILRKETTDSSEKPNKYYINIEYPNISGLTDTEIQDSINTEIDKYKKKSSERFQSYMHEIELPIVDSNLSSYFYIEYEASIFKNIFTLIFYLDHYFAGAAHPNHESHTMNFDLNNGKIIKIEDIFDKKSNYLTKLSELCIDYLKNKNEDLQFDEEWIKQGAGPEAENFKNFNIRQECFLITFDPYRVAPYASGFQSVELPYKKIKSIINKDGPLKEFYK